MLHHYPIERHSLLRKSFVHLNGIGPRTEHHLWQQAIKDWHQLRADAGQIFKGKRLDGIQEALDESLEAWERGDLYYFHRALPGNERWRLIAGGFEDIAYFDIEATDGGMPPLAESTAVAFYFRGVVLQEFEHHKKRQLIERMLAESSLICTYNGGAYDVPFLAAEYGLGFAKAHIDLCPWLRRQGHKGGLKAIQKSHGHLHQRTSKDINGYDAVRLWRMHELGVPGALETLLTYNAEDVLILEQLLVEAFNHEVVKRPLLELERLSAGSPPPLSTEVDPHVYELL